MAVDERRRVELFEALATAIGREATVTLFEVLPPSGEEPATARQLAALEGRVAARFDRVDDRFARVDDRFAALEQRMDDRFAALEQRMDDRFEQQRHELLAAFRGELVTAVSGQTRAVIVATATAVFGLGGLAVTLSQLL
jgi:hypothetical protein